MKTSSDNAATPGALKRLTSSLIEQGKLSDVGAWLAAQLRVVKYWAERQVGAVSPGEDIKSGVPNQTIPPQWEMTKGIDLWPWQRQCADAWFSNGKKGIAKVVTGAGKTIFALHVMERLQREEDPQLRVAVIVPTIVLMHQWVDALQRFSNLPRRAIGLLGGGHKDDLAGEKPILVSVLNSAAKLLAPRGERSGHADHLLLVVDECHRARGQSMSQVFLCPRAFNLGLSATPEDDDSANSGRSQSRTDDDSLGDVVVNHLGPVVYELTVKEAIAQGILSTFEIRHYGLPLDADEKQSYEKHSREIRDLAKTLRAAAVRSKSGAPSSLFRFAQRLASAQGQLGADAERYVLEVRRRKQLLYRARNRARAVLELVQRSISENPRARILLFHESISEVMSLYFMLLREGFRVAVDHSELPESIRADSVELFRSGKAQVLVSARTLIEGFDVPTADVGIIAASSTSERQRIQTIGRVLRKPEVGTGNKTAIIHSLYVADTVDEMIFEKVDLQQVTGADRNCFFLWEPPPAAASPQERREERYRPIPRDGPPRTPKPTEAEIDWANLEPGDPYPGRYEGQEFQCDQQGNISTLDGRLVVNPQEIDNILRPICPRAAKFRVTPLKKAVLCWDRQHKTARFVGYLDQDFQLRERAPQPSGSNATVVSPHQSASRGYQIKRVRGIRRIVDDQGRYAMLTEQADDVARGNDATRIIKAIEKLEKEIGRPIREFEVDASNKAFCFVEGQRRDLGRLDKGFEFRGGT